jgi:hypothetical protein
MPKFRVLKGHDAWVVYEAIIEAPNEHLAWEFANSDRRADGIWTATGDVRQFDHCEVFEGEVEPVDDDEVVEEIKTIAVTGRQRDTILAALRVYQQACDSCGGDMPMDIDEIATNGGTQDALDLTEIDQLCEEINQ